MRGSASVWSVTDGTSSIDSPCSRCGPVWLRCDGGPRNYTRGNLPLIKAAVRLGDGSSGYGKMTLDTSANCMRTDSKILYGAPSRSIKSLAFNWIAGKMPLRGDRAAQEV